MTDAQSQLDIIEPDIELELGGEPICVREFSFLQGLKLGPLAKPLLDDLAQRMGPDNELSLDLLGSLFEQHSDITLQLMSASCAKPVDWISALSDKEGQMLLLNFWRVNSDFFVNRLLSRKMAALMQNHSTRMSSTAH